MSAPQAYNSFERILGTADSMTSGFIVLSHDLYQQSVDLSVSYILPQIINAGKLMLKPISQCLGEPLSEACEYSQLRAWHSRNGHLLMHCHLADIETSNNATAYTQTTATVPGASGTGFVAFAAQTGGSSSGSSGSSGSSTSSGSRPSASSSGGSPGPTSGAEKMVVGAILGAIAGIAGFAVLA